MSDDGWNCCDCNRHKSRDAYPPGMGRCWACTWDQHIADKHPLSWAERREIRRFARAFARRQAVKTARNKLVVINLLPVAAGVGENQESSE